MHASSQLCDIHINARRWSTIGYCRGVHKTRVASRMDWGDLAYSMDYDTLTELYLRPSSTHELALALHASIDLICQLCALRL